jgi:hypothetical protein
MLTIGLKWKEIGLMINLLLPLVSVLDKGETPFLFFNL